MEKLLRHRPRPTTVYNPAAHLSVLIAVIAQYSTEHF